VGDDLLLTVSVLFGGLKPYRTIRRDHQDRFDPTWMKRGEWIGFRTDEADREEHHLAAGASVAIERTVSLNCSIDFWCNSPP
jgi:hypothetical protein